MNNHTGGGIRKGKRVMLILNNGTKIVGKFEGRKSGKIFVGSSAIPTSQIRSLSIYRG